MKQLKEYQEPEMKIKYLTWEDIVTNSTTEEENKTVDGDQNDFDHGW